jgi:hypothetical protein
MFFAIGNYGGKGLLSSVFLEQNRLPKVHFPNVPAIYFLFSLNIGPIKSSFVLGIEGVNK